MRNNVWIYLLIMFAVVYLVRVLPLTIFRKPIKNRFLRSFLYYAPYITLAVMTFPDIIYVTNSPFAGAAALIVGAVAAWMGAGLLPVAVCCSGVVLILELFLV